ncbi:MAG: V-type ATP synthase subunit A, partial [Crenarchaeota archaeon]|nr:V-type ATP synthase subunit A [Thermoproteota archaeon]
AAQRHYPAFDWLQAFSKYIDTVQEWWHKNIGPDWRQLRDQMMELLVKEAELMEIVRILGTEALSEYERHILNTAYMIREGFLKQDAFHPIDCRSPPLKTYWLMKILIEVYWRKGLEAVKRGVPAQAIRELELSRRLPRLRMEVTEKEIDKLKEFYNQLSAEIDRLVEQYAKK